METNELKKMLKNIVNCRSIKEAENLLDAFNPDRHPYSEPEWYYHGFMDYPAREFFQNGFDLNSVIVSSHFTEGDGPFFGYRYYKDILTALDCEIRISLSGFFWLWTSQDRNGLDPEFFPIVKEHFPKLVSLIDNTQVPGTHSYFDEIVQILEHLEERTFSTFTSINSYVLSWADKNSRYVHSTANLPQ